MLNVACFVQSRLTDADFVIFSNYCLIGTRRKAPLFLRPKGHAEAAPAALHGKRGLFSFTKENSPL